MLSKLCTAKFSAIKLLFKFKNDLQNTTQKIKDRATRTPLKFGGDVMCSGRVSSSSSCSTSDTRRGTLITNPVLFHERCV